MKRDDGEQSTASGVGNEWKERKAQRGFGREQGRGGEAEGGFGLMLVYISFFFQF